MEDHQKRKIKIKLKSSHNGGTLQKGTKRTIFCTEKTTENTRIFLINLAPYIKKLKQRIH